MGPQTPKQYFQNANEEKQFFQPSHQNSLQSELYSSLKKGKGEETFYFLVEETVITGRRRTDKKTSYETWW